MESGTKVEVFDPEGGHLFYGTFKYRNLKGDLVIENGEASESPVPEEYVREE